VSGIELNEINNVECEFLAGIDFDFYVDKETYVCWVGLWRASQWQRKGVAGSGGDPDKHLMQPPSHDCWLL
jgi:hypothetical protein